MGNERSRWEAGTAPIRACNGVGKAAQRQYGDLMSTEFSDE